MCQTLRRTAKAVKIHNFFVCTYKSQDFAQRQKMFAWSQDRETVTFRNSGLEDSEQNDDSINQQIIM